MHDLRRSQTSSLDLLLCRIDQNILKLKNTSKSDE